MQGIMNSNRPGISGVKLGVHYYTSPDVPRELNPTWAHQVATAAIIAHIGLRVAITRGFNVGDTLYLANPVDNNQLMNLFDVLDPNNGFQYVATVQMNDRQVPSPQITADARIYLRTT